MQNSKSPWFVLLLLLGYSLWLQADDKKLEEKIRNCEIPVGPALEQCCKDGGLFSSGLAYVVGSELLSLAGSLERGFLVAVSKMPEPYHEVALLAISSSPSLPRSTVFSHELPYKLLFYERNPAIDLLSIKKLVPIPEFNDGLALDEIFVKVTKSPYPDVPYLLTVIACGSPVKVFPLKEKIWQGVAGVYLANLQEDYSVSGSIYFEELGDLMQGPDRNTKEIWPRHFSQRWEYCYYDFDNDGFPERIVIPISRKTYGKLMPYEIKIIQRTKTGFQMLDPLEQHWPSNDLFVEFHNSNRDVQALDRLLSRLAGD